MSSIAAFSNEEVKSLLEKLEGYSLKTSEDINDDIENIVNCINSNSNALEKSLEELSVLKDSKREVEEGANRIL